MFCSTVVDGATCDTGRKKREEAQRQQYDLEQRYAAEARSRTSTFPSKDMDFEARKAALANAAAESKRRLNESLRKSGMMDINDLRAGAGGDEFGKEDFISSPRAPAASLAALGGVSLQQLAPAPAADKLSEAVATFKDPPVKDAKKGSKAPVPSPVRTSDNIDGSEYSSYYSYSDYSTEDDAAGERRRKKSLTKQASKVAEDRLNKVLAEHSVSEETDSDIIGPDEDQKRLSKVRGSAATPAPLFDLAAPGTVEKSKRSPRRSRSKSPGKEKAKAEDASAGPWFSPAASAAREKAVADAKAVLDVGSPKPLLRQLSSSLSPAHGIRADQAKQEGNKRELSEAVTDSVRRGSVTIKLDPTLPPSHPPPSLAVPAPLRAASAAAVAQRKPSPLRRAMTAGSLFGSKTPSPGPEDKSVGYVWDTTDRVNNRNSMSYSNTRAEQGSAGTRPGAGGTMEKLPIKTVEEEFNSMNFGKNAIQDNKYRGIDSFRIDQYNKWDTASEKSESRGSQVNVFIPSEVEIRPPKPQLQKKKTQIIGFNEYVGIDAGDSL